MVSRQQGLVASWLLMTSRLLLAGRRRPTRICFLKLSVVVLLSGCTDVTGPYESPQRAIALGERIFGAGKVHWFIPDSVGAWTMHPLLDGSQVYFNRSRPISATGAVLGPAELRAMDRATGALVWKGTIVSAMNAAVAGNMVGAVWGSLPIFDRATGVRTHLFSFAPTSLSSNVVSDGIRFYVGSHDGHVLAVNPTSGAVVWNQRLAGGLSTVVHGLGVSDDALAVTLKHFRTAGEKSDSTIVAVLDRQTGALRWRRAFAAPPGSDGVQIPIIANGQVIFATHRHEVYAFDLATGVPRWHRNVAFSTVPYGSNGLDVCDGMVIMATGDLGLIAMAETSGATRWRLPDLRDGSLARLECSYGTVLVGGSSLHVFDARTGALRARYPVREPDGPREFYIASVTRDAESLYVGTTYGYARVAAP